MMTIQSSNLGNYTPPVTGISPDFLPSQVAYNLELPVGWRALRVVLYPTGNNIQGSKTLDTADCLRLSEHKYELGVLLCRAGATEQTTVREFEAGVCWETAILDQNGEYLKDASVRPIFGLLPLTMAGKKCKARKSRTRECMVVVPLVFCTHALGGPDSRPVLFVNRAKVTPYPNPDDERQTYTPRPKQSVPVVTSVMKQPSPNSNTQGRPSSAASGRGSGAFPAPPKDGRNRIKAFFYHIENSLIGDLIGMICLLGLFCAGMLAVEAFQ